MTSGDLFAPEATPSGLLFRSGKLADAMPLVMAHHYSRRRTADPMFVFLWQTEAGQVQAAAIFTSPVNRFFGRGAIELSRLVRVPELEAPITQFIALCLRWLKKHTFLTYCLSYAEQAAGHHGGVYQAANFTHVAVAKGSTMYRHRVTKKVISGRSYDQSSPEYQAAYEAFRTGAKYLYVYPLRKSLPEILHRFNWTPLPFPKPDAAP